jgi:hypothetical protein
MAGCQDAVIKAVFKCQDAYAKAYGKCTKDAIKLLPGDPSSMAACLSGLLAKASKSCNKIGDAISKKCGGVDLKAAFPGCRGSADLATCLTQSVDCRTCYALRKVDGLDAVCEGCLPIDPMPAAWECSYDPHAFCVGGDKHLEPCLDVAFAEQICWPNGQGMCVGNTSGFFTTADSPPSGGADIAVAARVSVLFGPVDPNTGIASARFSLTGPSDPISLGPIGDVCLFPAPDEICDEPGFIDCDGGTPLDKDEQMFHNIGLCGIADIGHDPNDTDPNNYTGGPECLAMCEAKCDELTADPNYPYVYQRIPSRSQCEGYCIGGHKHDLPCTFDVDCAFDTDPITPGIQWDLTGLSGMCQGGEPVAHAHACTCLCRGIGGAPGRPGAFHSEQAVYSNVEQNAPCDGVDITMFSPTCNAHATERFQTTIINVDMSGSDLVFPPERGNPAMCQQLIDRNAELMFFRAHTTTTDDATSGDNSALSRAACFKHSAGNYYDTNCSLPLGGHPDDYCDLLDPNGNPVDPNSP